MRPKHRQPADDRSAQEAQRTFFRDHFRPRPLEHGSGAATDYFARLAALRLQVIRELYEGGTVVDLCCGPGDYLLAAADSLERLVGIDFSPELIATARQRLRARSLPRVTCLLGDATALPMAAGSVSLIYCFSSLYAIPAAAAVTREVRRVLAPGGRAILEFGAFYSLNTLVCRALSHVAPPYHLPMRDIHRLIADAGLQLERDRSFQLLPLWGDRPRWLRPLLDRRWQRWMAMPIGDRMLDERLSSLWPLRRFAFRHLMVCRKPEAAPR